MNHKAVLLFIIIVFALAACKRHEGEREQLLQLADRRVAGSELARFAMHPNNDVKRYAAIALGQIRDPQSVALLADLLRDRSPAVRVEAAFAFGQMGLAYTHRLLELHLAEEKDLEARLTLIEALSKVANDSALAAVDSSLSAQLNDDIPIVRGEVALALGRLAYRGFRRPQWKDHLLRLLDDDGEEVRWRAAYALMRLADSSSSPALRAALQDRSSRVRMQAARALGVLHDDQAEKALVRVANTDSDWRVRANAATALGNLEWPEGVRPEDRLPVRDVNEHVRLTALRALGIAAAQAKTKAALFPTDSVASFLIRTMNQGGAACHDSTNWRDILSAAISLAQSWGSQAIPHLLPFIDCAEPRVRAGVAEALGQTSEQALELLNKLADDASTLVKIAALEALPKISAQNRALPIYLSAVNSGDPVLAAIAAQNLAADSVNNRQHAAAIMAGYYKLPAPVDVEAAQMIFEALAKCGDRGAEPLLQEALKVPDKPFAQAAAKALERLTGKSCDSLLPKETVSHQQFTYEDIDRLSGAWASVETDAGEFEIEFFTNEAPLVVLNFVRLAEKKFFEGLLIHRVVPNYVIQTGDPRGDMWGSPGYSIRSEFSRLRYGRGSIGMASIGPDTEGCQWFITHSEQPHLDGRYSLFARVRKGMEIVDALQVGNRLVHVEIHY